MEALFFHPDIHLTDLHKGLTNQNYLFEFDNAQYVLRVPKHDSNKIVHRHHETLALKVIAQTDLDIETIYYDEYSGYKVTKYIPNTKTYGECTYEDKIERVAHLMKKLHSLQTCIGVSFDPIKRLHQYRSYIKQPMYDLTIYDPFLKKIDLFKNPHTLCHNDWVDGNILFTTDRCYLIDYEYAGDNDPLFDVISFLTENQIYDEQLRQRFYKAYFPSFNDTIHEQLLIWEVCADILWCTWAMMMYETRQEPIYTEIANEKHRALLQVLKHPLLQKGEVLK